MSTRTTDRDRRQQTYHDRDQAREPGEITDPTLTHDESRRTLADRISDNPKLALIAGVFGTLVLAVLAWWSRPFLLGLVQNTYFQVFVGILTVFAVGAVANGKRVRGLITQQAECVVYYDDERPPDPFQVEFTNTQRGRAFTPYKGLRGWGPFKSYQPVSKRELTNNPYASTEPATVLLPRDTYDERLTDRGVKGVVLTGGLEPYDGEEVNMIATLPEAGNRDAMAGAIDQLMELQRDLDAMEEQVETEQRRREEQQAKAVTTMSDLKTEVMDIAAMLSVASGSRKVDLEQLDQLTSEDMELVQYDEDLAPEDDHA